MRAKIGPILLICCWLFAWADDLSPRIAAAVTEDGTLPTDAEIFPIAAAYKRQIVQSIELAHVLPICPASIEIGLPCSQPCLAVLPGVWELLSGKDRLYLLMSLQR